MIKRIMVICALVPFLAALAFSGMALYADSLYRERFDARAAQESEREAEVTSFSLFAEETEHQTKSRIAGWMSTVASQEVEIASKRGKLSATQYEPIDSGADAPWALLFHGGLGTDRAQVLDVACMLSLQGYRVLTPDLYAHGDSAGGTSTLGFGDAQDVHAWVNHVERERMGARIVLYGVDEGAAAVLMAACGGLSGSIAAVAADSAHSDGAARMLDVAQEEAGGFAAALLNAAFKQRTGGTQTALLKRISQAQTPLLLIHGTGDQSVPAWHSEDIALAAGNNAQLLYIEGAGHGLSRFVDPATYYETLLGFFEDKLK